MAEDIVEETLEEQPDTGTPPAEAQKPEPQQPEPEQPEEQSIPYSRFKEVNDRAKELQAQVDAIDAERKQADIDAKKAEGKYRELYEDMETKLAEQRIANEELRLNSLRKEVAQEHGHAYLWDRLRGETEEELASDLQTLIAEMPAAKAPSVNGAAGSGAREPDSGDMYSADELNELSAKLGIPVAALPKYKPIID